MGQGLDLTLANPTCFDCHGDGWNVATDGPCRCVRRADASGVETDASPDILSEEAKERLETLIRSELIDARRASATADAATIVRAIARGETIPSVRALAVYANVDHNGAARIMDLIRNAVQTTKKRRSQCQ